MIGDVEVLANNGLPEASRILSWRLCIRTGRSGRTRVEVHLSVRIDVEKNKPRKNRRQVRISAADAGCADTLTWHDGKRLRLPNHAAKLDRALAAQARMNRCTVGSRTWTESLERYRRCRRRMTGRDRDTVRKAAAKHAKRCDVTALEDVRSRPMSTRATSPHSQVRNIRHPMLSTT